MERASLYPSTVSGVDGATKLNNAFAPSKKITETESVSVVAVPKTIEDIDITSVAVESNLEPQKEEVKTIDIKFEFSKIVDIIKELYDKVFSKSKDFKPSFDETVGDIILYLSAKLNIDGIEKDFNNAFYINAKQIFEKYYNNYIPYALKLSVWCEKKSLLSVSENLLYEISSLYLKLANASGLTLTEEDVATKFSKEIEYAFN